MNKINTIETSYITSNETIELIEVSNSTTRNYVYLYNYQGVHFRLFSDLLEMINFFKNEKCNFIEFENDTEIDNYLENIVFTNANFV